MRNTPPSILEDFSYYLHQKGYQPSTIADIIHAAKLLIDFVNKPYTDVSVADIYTFHQFLLEKPNERRGGGMAESTISGYMYGVRVFFHWLEKYEYISFNPASGFVYEKKGRPHKERAWLSQPEIKLLYQHTQSAKEKALLAVFYGCGLRRKEGENLNCGDIHFQQQILYVRQGKQGKRRAVPMGNQVAEDIKNYLHTERAMSLPLGASTPALFLNHEGKRNSGNSLYRSFKNILERTPLRQDIGLHSLRHSIASHLLENGLPMHQVKEFLGHKHIESTQIYVKLKPNHLYEIFH